MTAVVLHSEIQLWMTAGLVQDADLDTGTVARADTKRLLSCQPRVRALHL